jgi:hypothetical protein
VDGGGVPVQRSPDLMIARLESASRADAGRKA